MTLVFNVKIVYLLYYQLVFIKQAKMDPNSRNGIVTSTDNLNNKRTTYEHIIRQHTAMPYYLGGNCAKYQGYANTYEYLKRDHHYIWDVYNDEDITEIIKNEISEWDYK